MTDTSSTILGVDIGTTAAKALVADITGRIIAEGRADYGVLTPRPTWAEQHADVWLDGMCRAIREVVKSPDVHPERIAAMSVSSLYGGSGIPVDDALVPTGPCLIWMDRRARTQAKQVTDEIPVNELVALTGNGVDSYYGITKILWLRDNDPDLWARTRYFLPPNAFLIHALTGELAVDHSSAGNIGGIYDLTARAWSETACDRLGIPVQRFPARLVGSSDTVGPLHARGAQLTGLPSGIPVCAGGVDAAVATLSAGVFAPGRHVAMLGTSMCWGFVHETPPTEPGLVSMPYVLEPDALTYTFGGAATAGAVPAWIREQLLGTTSASLADLDVEARGVDPGSDGLLFLPYLMGERSPIWDPDARGTITGLTLYHRRGHVYRAGLEGVAFALRHNIETGLAAGYPLDDVLHVVGGATRSPLWLQILADVVGMPVVVAAGGEAAYGDAMLAAVGIGAAEVGQLSSWVSSAGQTTRVDPDPSTSQVYDHLYPHYRGLYQDLRRRFTAMASGT